MPPKRELDLDLKKGDIVQAVIIADPFNKKFGPLTTPAQPKCLLPLANRPILAYTLDLLYRSGVQETIIYCTDFANEVRKYLALEDTWQDMVITTHGNEGCTSLGDAMRDLDSKGLLRGDFILIHGGDTVGNVNLAPLLESHKKRCLDDRNNIMTLVYPKAAPSHHCRTSDQEFIVATSSGGKLLHHARVNSKNVDFPISIFVDSDTVAIRYDLLESGIAICTHEVPPLFSDNFDCQTMDEFIKGTLESDLTDHVIYVSVLDDSSYVARISNMLCYMAISKDVLNRWLFPTVPDCHSRNNSYSYSRLNIYKAADVVIGRESILKEDVIIGPSSKVGEKSSLCNVSVGRNCKIGNSVSLRNCIVHDNVVIGDDCCVDDCVIGNDVTLGKNVKVNKKAVLGPGVEIPSEREIEVGQRLVSERPDTGFSDEVLQDIEGKFNSLGPKALCYESDDDDDDSGSSFAGPSKEDDPWGTLQESEEDEVSSSDDESELSTAEDMMPDIMLDEDAKYNVFFNEVLESLQRGANEGVKVDNLSLEINSSRHAYAVTSTQVIQAIYVSIMTISTSKNGSPESSAKLLSNAKTTMKSFHELISKYVKSPQAQLDCLFAIGTHACTNDQFMPIASKIIHHLFDVDILSEEAILKWYQTTCGVLREKVKTLVEWLEEDSEDSSEDDAD